MDKYWYGGTSGATKRHFSTRFVQQVYSRQSRKNLGAEEPPEQPEVISALALCSKFTAADHGKILVLSPQHSLCAGSISAQPLTVY